MSQCPFSNLLDPGQYKDGFPYEELKKIRSEPSIVKLDDPLTGVPYWVISRQKHLDFISKNPKIFSSREKTAFPMEYLEDREWMLTDVLRKQMINMDAPDHLNFRRIIRRVFTAKAVDAMKTVYRQHAKRIIDNVASKGTCEFVEDVASELPLIAILELLGVPLEDRKDFFHWTNTMIFADDPDMATSEEEGIAAASEVCAYAMNLALQERANPGKNMTLISQLLSGSVDGEGLSDEEFMWFFVLLLVGGNESTRTVISHGMRLLMEHPDQLEMLVEDPSLIPGAVEEILRVGTAFICMRRTAMRDIEIGGELVRKGDKVVMFYHSANQDESVFGDDAIKFDITRAQRMSDLKHQHRSFGIGQHFCIGSHLARSELNIMFEEIIPRLKNPAFVDKPKYVRSYFVNALKEMQIVFDPEDTTS